MSYSRVRAMPILNRTTAVTITAKVSHVPLPVKPSVHVVSTRSTVAPTFTELARRWLSGMAVVKSALTEYPADASERVLFFTSMNMLWYLTAVRRLVLLAVRVRTSCTPPPPPPDE
uniref:Uncharacterized protein n=1 Tax=Arundo donax TaxID=35708 RepID=A0A0A9GAB0_ARUDO